MQAARRRAPPLPPPPYPPPPIDLCLHCPTRRSCQAYRRCLALFEPEKRRHHLTTGDLVERAIGWCCLGFIIGVAVCRYRGLLP